MSVNISAFRGLTDGAIKYLRDTYKGVHYRDRCNYDDDKDDPIDGTLAALGLYEWADMKSGRITFDPFELLRMLAQPKPEAEEMELFLTYWTRSVPPAYQLYVKQAATRAILADPTKRDVLCAAWDSWRAAKGLQPYGPTYI